MVTVDDPRLASVGFAKFVGDGVEYFVRKYEVIIGRKSKNCEADLILGESMNISRQHAAVKYNFSTQHFELIVMGKNGVTVNGELYTPMSPPLALKTQDLITVGDKSVFFLLPKANPSYQQSYVLGSTPSLPLPHPVPAPHVPPSAVSTRTLLATLPRPGPLPIPQSTSIPAYAPTTTLIPTPTFTPTLPTSTSITTTLRPLIPCASSPLLPLDVSTRPHSLAPSLPSPLAPTFASHAFASPVSASSPSATCAVPQPARPAGATDMLRSQHPPLLLPLHGGPGFGGGAMAREQPMGAASSTTGLEASSLGVTPQDTAHKATHVLVPDFGVLAAPVPTFSPSMTASPITQQALFDAPSGHFGVMDGNGLDMDPLSDMPYHQSGRFGILGPNGFSY